MSSLEGKIAIVTGASSGIGRATARLLAEKGAKVVVADMDEAGGQETLELVTQAGAEGLFVKMDVTLPADVQNLVGKTLSAYGAVDVLHNNAGIYRIRETIDEVSEEEWRLIIDVDLNSLFLLARAVYPIMRAQGGGVIVNTASMAAFHAVPHGLAYASAKGGVVGLTRSLAALGEKDNVRVNCICPSAVKTPLLTNAHPGLDKGIMLSTEDIATAVHYLAAHDSLSGAAISIQLKDGKAQYLRARETEWEPVRDI